MLYISIWEGKGFNLNKEKKRLIWIFRKFLALKAYTFPFKICLIRNFFLFMQGFCYRFNIQFETSLNLCIGPFLKKIIKERTKSNIYMIKTHLHNLFIIFQRMCGIFHLCICHIVPHCTGRMRWGFHFPFTGQEEHVVTATMATADDMQLN